MAEIEFKDNSVQVKAAIRNAARAFLDEVGGEIASQAAQNSRRASGQTAGSFTYKTDVWGENYKVTVGSPLENAMWEELGTGEYAIHGDGRKGYWVFVEGQSSGGKGGKTYTLEEAKRVMAILRRKGLNAFYTNGKRPNRALQTAFDRTAPLAREAAENTFGRID